MRRIIIASLTVLFGLLSQNAKAQNIEDENSRLTAKTRQAMPVEYNEKTAENYLKEKEALVGKMEEIQNKMSKLKNSNPQYQKLSDERTNIIKEYTHLLQTSSMLSTSMSTAQLQKSIDIDKRWTALSENYRTHGNLKDARKADKAQARAEKEEARRQAEAQKQGDDEDESLDSESGKGFLSKMKAAGNKMAESTTNLYNKAKDKIVQDKPENSGDNQSEDEKVDVDAMLDNLEMTLDEMKIAVNKKNRKMFLRTTKEVSNTFEILSKQEMTQEQQLRLGEQSQRLSDYTNKMLDQK